MKCPVSIAFTLLLVAIQVYRGKGQTKTTKGVPLTVNEQVHLLGGYGMECPNGQTIDSDADKNHPFFCRPYWPSACIKEILQNCYKRKWPFEEKHFVCKDSRFITGIDQTAAYTNGTTIRYVICCNVPSNATLVPKSCLSKNATEKNASEGVATELTDRGWPNKTDFSQFELKYCEYERKSLCEFTTTTIRTTEPPTTPPTTTTQTTGTEIATEQTTTIATTMYPKTTETAEHYTTIQTTNQKATASSIATTTKLTDIQQTTTALDSKPIITSKQSTTQRNTNWQTTEKPTEMATTRSNNPIQIFSNTTSTNGQAKDERRTTQMEPDGGKHKPPSLSESEEQAKKDSDILNRVRKRIQDRNKLKTRPTEAADISNHWNGAPFPLSATEKFVADIAHQIGCAFVIGTCTTSIIVSVIIRNSLSDRILHLCEELCLILEYLLMAVTVQIKTTGMAHHCYFVSLGIQFFGVAKLAFLFLEALHVHAVITNMVFERNLLPTHIMVYAGLSIPIAIYTASAIFLYDFYPSQWSCWVNWSHRAVQTTYVMSILALGMLAIILVESAGMWSDMKPAPAARKWTRNQFGLPAARNKTVKPKKNNKQTIIIDANRHRVHLARINRIGVFVIVPLQLLSELVGSYGIHAMCFTVILQLFTINVTLAFTVLIAHTIGNKQVYEWMVKIGHKVRQKRK